MDRRLNNGSKEEQVDSQVKELVAKTKWTKEEAATIVSAWRDSGMSLAGFARMLGVGPQRIRWWRDEVGKRPKKVIRRKRGSVSPTRGSSSTLKPVKITAPPMDRGPGSVRLSSFVEVELSNGRRVRFGVGAEPAAVAELVVQLEAL